MEIEGKISYSSERVARQCIIHTLNLSIGTIKRGVKANLGGTMFSRPGQYLLFADDVAVLGYAVRH